MKSRFPGTPCASFARVPIASIPDDHDESNDQAPSKIIGYIPPIARGLFFPPPEECTEVPTVAEAIDYMVTSKAAPVVSLYVICGIDPQANRNLQKLFERYPVRITWLKSTDFCPQKSLPFPGVSTCTVAAVYGALQLPGLIIESGNSINLTTVDENGHVVVASVVMGSFSHFENAIQDDSGAEGIGDSPDANELVNNFLKRNQPLLDADPNVDRLCGIQPLLHTIFQLMKNFVEKYGPSDSDDGNILIHGSHGRVLHSLLQEENLSYISKELVSCFIPKVKLDDHLVHRGIGNMLMHYDKLVTPGSDREKCLHFVGRRVARAFPQDYMDPDQAVTYRGVVSSFVSVKNGDAWDDNMFEVIYDDGDREELNVEELYGKLLRLIKFVEPNEACLSRFLFSRGIAFVLSGGRETSACLYK